MPGFPHGTPAGLRAAHRRGAQGPPHPALVHRRAGPAQVGGHLSRRARERLRRGDALRRLRHRRVQPGPGERRPRQARPQHLRAAAVGPRRQRDVRPDVLRHPEPRRHPVRGRPPPGPAAQPGPGPRPRLLVHGRPPDGVLLLRQGGPLRAARAPRLGLLLRPHHGRRGQRPAQAHPAGAREHGHPRRVLVPRGRPQPARDRPALHRRPHHGRHGDDLPHGREGDRPRAGRLRHVHAQAPRRRAGLGDAHPHVAVRGRRERLPRAGRPLRPVEGGPGLHRRAAAPRPRDHRRHQPAGELLQAAHRRLRGARLRHLGPQQPVRPRAGAGHQAGQAVLDSHRVPLPGSRLQPLPRLLGHARRRAAGASRRATSCRPRPPATCSR